MPRNETILSVFVASPSDVLEERKALESITQELNKTWSKNLNLRLDLIKWETDVHPGFGDYSQDVINKQINDEYDVFIAIFWGRIGNPTQVANSGTIEEFDRAFKKYSLNKSSVDIMVYFKDQAIPPSKMDFDQLQKIQELKKRLGEQGGFYCDFDTTEDFESLLRGHLSKIAQKWSSKSHDNLIVESKHINNLMTTHESNIANSIDEDEEYGLLDYFEIYEDRMFNMTASISSITEATEKIGSQFTRRAEEINSSSDEHGQFDTKHIKKIIKLSSGDLERYAEIIESQINIVSSSREEAFDALSKALSIYVDFKEANEQDNLISLEESIEKMKEAVSGSNEGLASFREILSNMPRLTISLNKSKRRVLKAIDTVSSEVMAMVHTANSILKLIYELKNDMTKIRKAEAAGVPLFD